MFSLHIDTARTWRGGQNQVLVTVLGLRAAGHRAMLVAQFAEVLRQSVHARGDSFGDLVADAARLERELADPDFTEFAALLVRYQEIATTRRSELPPHWTCAEDLRRNECLRVQLEESPVAADGELAFEIERRSRELEDRLHALLREHLQRARR